MHWCPFISPRHNASMAGQIPFHVEPMQLADIPHVIAVEQAAYTMQWPQRAYEYELTQNKLAHYFILRANLPDVTGVIGMGGFWLLADEAHISTLAIDPARQRQGLGEWLLIALLEAAGELGAAIATLEVRPSNRAALKLYQKYNFQQAGRRPRYYPDNGEDALILTTPSLASPEYQTMLNRRKRRLAQRLARIGVDKTG